MNALALTTDSNGTPSVTARDFAKATGRTIVRDLTASERAAYVERDDTAALLNELLAK